MQHPLFSKVLRFILACCICLGIVSIGHADLSKKRILLLYSYHPTFPTAPKVLEGIQSVFAKDGPTIEIEYMDSKRLYDATSLQNFTQLLSYKVETRAPYDLIISADDNALNFMLSQGKALLPNVPLVFLGVNNIDLAVQQDSNPNVTGVVEASSFKETIQLASTIQPSRPKLHIVVDSTPSGQADLKTVRQLTGQFPQLEFNTLSLKQLSWGELKMQLKKLGEQDQVLLLSAYRDRESTPRSFNESLALIRNNTDVPIYHLWEHGMGAGILGGILVSHREQGVQAALMAEQILSGNNIKDIPVLQQSPNIPTFDSRQLKRYHIDTDLLPQNALILFKPAAIWETHRLQIIIFVTLMMIMAIVVVYLIKQNQFRHSAIKTIRSKEGQLRTTLNSIGDAVISTNAQGQIINMNPVAERLVGKTIEQTYGQPFYEVFHFFTPESIEASSDLVQQVLQDKQSEHPHQHTVLLGKDDLQYHVSVSTSPFNQDKDGYPGAVIVFRDITEEHRIQLALEASEARFRDFADAAADWLWEMGPDLTFSYFSGRIEEVIGVDKNSLIGKNRQQVYGDYQDYDSPTWQHHFQRIEQRQPFTDLEVTWRRPDNQVRFISISGKPRFNDRGEFLGYRGIGRDITEQKRVAKRVQQMDTMYRNLVENIPGAAYRCKLDENWTMEFISQGVEELTGFPSSDFINNSIRSYASIIHPDDSTMVDEKVRDAVDHNRPFILVYRILHANGTIRWVWERGRASDRKKDKQPHLEGVMADITDQKETEEALRRAQKMDAVGQMAGGIAHDFNNILGIILGNLSLLEEHLSGQDKTLKRIKMIEKSAQRAADLTKQLLGFSRKLAAEESLVDLNAIINHMDSLIRRSITPQVEVTKQLADGLWPTRIDPGDFENALLNLVINARDAMQGKGRLAISTKNITLTDKFCQQNPGAIPGEFVKLTIQDTGEGIPADLIDRIFEPFFTTKPQGQGTGLGLAMVFGFTKRSQGYIKVLSDENIGTTFYLYLPRALGENPLSDGTGGSKTESPRGDQTILAVDDEEDLLHLAQESLEVLGYRVLTANSGRQALTTLAEHPEVDLLFSDVVMPGGINGFELIRQVKEKYPGIKILLTSGYADQSISKGEQLDTELLSKPYSLSDLAHSIAAALKSPTKNS